LADLDPLILFYEATHYKICLIVLNSDVLASVAKYEATPTTTGVAIEVPDIY